MPPFATFETLNPVTPLDAQFGSQAPVCVPPELQSVLFPENTDVLALIDLAKFVQGLQLLEDHPGPKRCMFTNDAEEELADIAPYLVRLGPDDALTRILLTHHPDWPADWTTRHAHHREAAMFFHIPKAATPELRDAAMDRLWRHFRRFLRVPDARNTWYFFRFWEPQLLQVLQEDNAPETDLITRLFCQDQMQAALGYAGQTMTVLRPSRTSAPVTLRVSEADDRLLRRMRRMQFVDKVERALKDANEIWSPDGFRERLVRLYREGLHRGYRIEAAIYLFIRSAYALERFGLTIDPFEARVDPETVLSPLNRAKAIWAIVEQDYCHD